jgi:quinol monooxygenase YgiN
MSVIMVLQMDGDPAKFEEYAAANPEKMAGIRDRAVEKGLIAHRFFADDNGHVLVVDEWPDREAFEGFFGEAQAEIGQMLQDVGVTSEPHPQYLRVLETHDKYGWES